MGDAELSHGPDSPPAPRFCTDSHHHRDLGCSIAAGALLGIVFGLALTYGGRVGSAPFRIVVDVVRGTPVLVLIFASYYMPSGLGLSPGPITAGDLLSPFSALLMWARRSAARSSPSRRLRPTPRARSG